MNSSQNCLQSVSKALYELFDATTADVITDHPRARKKYIKFLLWKPTCAWPMLKSSRSIFCIAGEIFNAAVVSNKIYWLFFFAISLQTESKFERFTDQEIGIQWWATVASDWINEYRSNNFWNSIISSTTKPKTITNHPEKTFETFIQLKHRRETIWTVKKLFVYLFYY